MADDPTGAVQVGLKAALTSLGVGVYDEVPSGATYPYVTLAGFTEVADDTHSTLGSNVTAMLHFWSGYTPTNRVEGYKQLQGLMGQARAILHRGTLDLTSTGWRFVAIRHLLTTMNRQETARGIVRHGVQRYRIQVEEA